MPCLRPLAKVGSRAGAGHLIQIPFSVTMPGPAKKSHQLIMAARTVVLRKILRPNLGSSKNHYFDQCDVYHSTRVRSSSMVVFYTLSYCFWRWSSQNTNEKKFTSSDAVHEQYFDRNHPLYSNYIIFFLKHILDCYFLNNLHWSISA